MEEEATAEWSKRSVVTWNPTYMDVMLLLKPGDGAARKGELVRQAALVAFQLGVEQLQPLHLLPQGLHLPTQLARLLLGILLVPVWLCSCTSHHPLLLAAHPHKPPGSRRGGGCRSWRRRSFFDRCCCSWSPGSRGHRWRGDPAAMAVAQNLLLHCVCVWIQGAA